MTVSWYMPGMPIEEHRFFFHLLPSDRSDSNYVLGLGTDSLLPQNITDESYGLGVKKYSTVISLPNAVPVEAPNGTSYQVGDLPNHQQPL